MATISVEGMEMGSGAINCSSRGLYGGLAASPSPKNLFGLGVYSKILVLVDHNINFNTWSPSYFRLAVY